MDVSDEDLSWALFAGIVAANVLSRGIARAGSKEGPFGFDVVARSSRQARRPLAYERPCQVRYPLDVGGGVHAPQVFAIYRSAGMPTKRRLPWATAAELITR
jgi:hypothetical protein